jgi:HD-GYP domain-containing protein (c-di-GMP phosphodiesterase class II)
MPMADNPLKKATPAVGKSQDRDADDLTVVHGRDLVTHLCVLMKTAQIHDPSNIALVNPSDNLVNTLKQIWQWHKTIRLHLIGDYLFLDDLRLRMDLERFASFTFVIEELKRVGLGGVTFRDGIGSEDLRRFAYIVAQVDPKTPEPAEVIAEEIQKRGISGIEVEPLEEKQEEYQELKKTVKEQAKTNYFKTMTTVTEAMDNIKMGRVVSVKRAKRSVQGMVDTLLTDESTLLGLTTLRSHDVYTHNHSVNVCILALSVGQRLGYTTKQLTLLGLSGLFHDMGKANIPPEILNKATDFTEEDWQMMRQHPVEGVKYLLRLKGINELTIRIVSGAFEHHLNYDLSGYPRLKGPWSVSLFGRIISICDCYDALTSSRVYNRVPYSPEKALKFMLSRSGKAFDPIIMKVFVNSIGIFPVGTLVMLNTRELAVVVGPHPDPDKGDRPRIKLIADTGGQEIDGDVVDLSQPEELSRRSVAKTLDATLYKIDVSKYFI